MDRERLLVRLASRRYTRHYFTRFELDPNDVQEVTVALFHALQTPDMFELPSSFLTVVPKHKRFEMTDEDYHLVRIGVQALIEAALATGGRDSVYCALVALNTNLLRIRSVGLRTRDDVTFSHAARQIMLLSRATDILVKHNRALHELCHVSDLLVSGRKNAKRRRTEEDDEEEQDDQASPRLA